MTRRRWIADTWNDNSATLTGDHAAHLARVLRAEPGTQCDVIAGGHLWRAAIASVADDEVRFQLIEELEADPALPVTLLLSIFKFDRMEWAIEKATELGVERIVPVIAGRTEKHLALAAAKRIDRWHRIVAEAAQQSRRSDTPEIADAVLLKNALQRIETGPTIKIVLAEQEESTTLKGAIDDALAAASGPLRIRIAIGPEGGWAPEEVALFDAEGWKPATLGPRILRAETAAIAALSVVAALLG